MAVVTMKELLEAGVHFGHRTRRWHPKMRSYIFTERNGIHIIDLEQTISRLEEACGKVKEVASEGGTILFVGTKKQGQESIALAAESCGMPYVNERWLGGTLTNFRTIRQRIDYLLDLEARYARGDFEGLSKKEALGIEREIARLNRRLGGIKEMLRLPDMVFIVDIRREDIAVKEAHRLGIPIVAMVDTNCDPDPIDFVIPANDDAIRAIKLICGKIAEAVQEGRQIWESLRAEEEVEAPLPVYLAAVAPEETEVAPSEVEFQEAGSEEEAAEVEDEEAE
ncbi:MAG TPA: 30S ribosomal protein S2 [Chloroflexi bacterium]|nr:30S ribosomal protein S2 [Chloroflexota bacterium]